MRTNFDFTVPQRQSLIGVLVLFANTLQKSIRAFWPLLVVFLFRKELFDRMYVYIGIIILILLIAIIAFLKYWFFKFYIDSNLEEFVIESGILNKTKTTIQLHKIQKVDINQSLIQRIFNVHKLEIDTAGSDKKEASIGAISEEMAVNLKSRLIENSKKQDYNGNADDFQSEQEPKSFITISLGSLIKIGFTANYMASLAYLFLVFSTISENLKQIGQESLIDDNVSKLDEFPLTTVLMIALGLIIFSVLFINLVMTIVKYFNFTIKRDENTFILSYGLINLKNTIINPEKVQIIKWTQNFFQRKLNVNTIEIKQASSDEKRAKNKDKTKIPGCNNDERIEILKLLIEKLPKYEKELHPNIRKLLLNSFIFILIPVTIGLFVNNYNNKFETVQAIGLATLYSLFIGVIILFSYKNYRLYTSTDFVVKKSGAWDIDYELIQPHKIQGIKTFQLFWQKRTNIGSVTLYTAGGNISFRTTNYSELKKLVNYWLYQVEVSKRNWM